jgi:hypothetical protein
MHTESMLTALRAELKDIKSAMVQLAAAAELLQHANQQLQEQLSRERSASLRVNREHEEQVARLREELTLAQLMLGDALGEPVPPRNSLVVRKPNGLPTERQSQRTAETVRPRADITR